MADEQYLSKRLAEALAIEARIEDLRSLKAALTSADYYQKCLERIANGDESYHEGRCQYVKEARQALGMPVDQ